MKDSEDWTGWERSEMLKLQSNVVRALKCSSRCNFYFLNLYETIKTLVFFFLPESVESNDINFEAWMVK
ncbi:hypothetical protein RchiOBHm_Chr1g0343291 [Rosa chinensis]|uniref:Uncharacterized protein n=1 Tax=Rosa chinensis TaxID=74649 RepID=A0A2P6SE96_ROSCH|nr:hypothetical protein RchiOBHm_Chr1g0343291 [Rosa chinensis]